MLGSYDVLFLSNGLIRSCEIGAGRYGSCVVTIVDPDVGGALVVEVYVGLFLSKEETLMALDNGLLVIVIPEFKLPLQTLSVVALVDEFNGDDEVA